MRVIAVVRVLLALLVALLLPLEQARCACRMAREAATTTATASHACCAKPAPVVQQPMHACCAASAAAEAPMPERDCGGRCACYASPAESAPVTTIAPASASTTLSPLAALAVVAALADPATTPGVAAPPPDEGGPPRSHAARAHGLRAPPATL